jgi:Protein of unknown function (DUF3095)
MNDKFFESLPVFTQFEGVIDPTYYTSLPDDWLLATSDIVESTKAIEAGRYKAVNMAGASVIAAILNALGHKDVPFVFGGDGAVVAMPGSAEVKTRAALAAVQTLVSEELQLTLRAAIVPVRDIRANGSDVRLAKYQVGADAFFAMFSGGGASWAEKEMKAGRYAVAPALPGTRPDLTGLSCRWSPIEARHGEILSVIAVPGPKAEGKKFENLVSDVLLLAGKQDRGGHPVPAEGPAVSLSTIGSEYEARMSSVKEQRLKRKLVILWECLVIVVLNALNLKIRGFDMRFYRRDVAQNSDFRKFDDGLKMTVDLSIAQSRQIEERLEEASNKGICMFGIHRQSSALMTCIVPSVLTRDHVHFVDGASGGYAMAASQLKAKAAI